MLLRLRLMTWSSPPVVSFLAGVTVNSEESSTGSRGFTLLVRFYDSDGT